MARYFLEISYDGTNFHGWQFQPNAITVQEEIEKNLQILLGKKIETVGCGRTDTGVHAKQFFLHFDCDTNLPDELVYKLNRILPSSIAVFKIHHVHDTAHARFDASSRTYHYYYHIQKDPFLEGKSSFLFGGFNLDLMNEGAKIICSYTDFTSFSKAHTNTKTNNCKITEAYWMQNEHQLIFTITADRFLRNMVRAIVGTLTLVGKEKISLDELKKIIECKNRSEAGDSVPACGLYLSKIKYPFIKNNE